MFWTFYTAAASQFADNLLQAAETVDGLCQVIQAVLAGSHGIFVQFGHGFQVEVKSFVCQLDVFIRHDEDIDEGIFYIIIIKVIIYIRDRCVILSIVSLSAGIELAEASLLQDSAEIIAADIFGEFFPGDIPVGKEIFEDERGDRGARGFAEAQVKVQEWPQAECFKHIAVRFFRAKL